MLLDEIMPNYQFNTVHSAVIHAPRGDIYTAIKETRVSDVPLMNTLFQIRSLPGYLTSRGKRYFINNDMTILEQAITNLGFVILAGISQMEPTTLIRAPFWVSPDYMGTL